MKRMKHFATFMSFRMHALPKEGSASGLSFVSVQRLEEISPRIAEFAAYLPIVLIGLVEHDIELLEKREALIASGKHKGNTRESKEYKTSLPQQCTAIQFEWAVGMILSDASLQYNTNCKSCRLKMQQVDYHYAFMAISCYVLAPWIYEGISAGKQREKSVMHEMQTITHVAFMPLADLFQNPCVQKRKNAVISKVISPNIEKYLTPLCVAAWFMGDGGRQCYKENGGKGLQFHTQGFTEADVQMLVSALSNRYGWKTKATFDGKNKKGQETFLISVSGESFDSFVHHISPFIPDSFKYKLPDVRKPKSRFKKEY